jgi:hypothetical protein
MRAVGSLALRLFLAKVPRHLIGNFSERNVASAPRCGAASLPQLSSWCMLTRMDDADRELRRRFETAYDENGVDRSQIRQRLALSPEERLARVDETANALRELRAGMEIRDDQLSSDSRSPHTAPR